MDIWPRRPFADYSAGEIDRFRKSLETLAIKSTGSVQEDGFYFALAVQSYLLGDNLAAIDYLYDHIETSSQSDAESHFLLARIHAELEQISQAEAAFNRVLELDPTNVEAILHFAWLKLNRGLNHDADIATATNLLETLENLNRVTNNTHLSAKQEKIFLDLKCELLSRTSANSVSTIKLQSYIQNYPRHLGLHILILETHKNAEDYVGALMHFDKHCRYMRNERRWFEVGLALCNTALGESDPMSEKDTPLESLGSLALADVHRIKLSCCDSLLALLARKASEKPYVELLLQTFSTSLKSAATYAEASANEKLKATVSDFQSRLLIRTAEVHLRLRNWSKTQTALNSALSSRKIENIDMTSIEWLKHLELQSRVCRIKYDAILLESTSSSSIKTAGALSAALADCVSIDAQILVDCGTVTSDLNAVIALFVWYINRGLVSAVADLLSALFGNLPAVVSGEEAVVYSDLALSLEFFVLHLTLKNALPAAVDQILGQFNDQTTVIHPLALFDAESHQIMSDADSSELRLWLHGLVYLQVQTNAAIDEAENVDRASQLAGLPKLALLSQRPPTIASPTSKTAPGGLLFSSPISTNKKRVFLSSEFTSKNRFKFFMMTGGDTSGNSDRSYAVPPSKLDSRGSILSSLKEKRKFCIDAAEQPSIASVLLMQTRTKRYQTALHRVSSTSSSAQHSLHWIQACVEFYAEILKQVVNVAVEKEDAIDEAERILTRATPAVVYVAKSFESLRRHISSSSASTLPATQLQGEEDNILSLLLDTSTPDTLLLLGELIHQRLESSQKKIPAEPISPKMMAQAADCLDRLQRADVLTPDQEKRHKSLISDLGMFGIVATRRRSISSRSVSPAIAAQSPRRSGSASAAEESEQSGDDSVEDEASYDDYDETDDISHDDESDGDIMSSDDERKSSDQSKRSLFSTLQRHVSQSPASKRNSSPSPQRRRVSASPSPSPIRTTGSGSASSQISLPQIAVENVPTMASRLSELKKLTAQTKEIASRASGARPTLASTPQPSEKASSTELPGKPSSFAPAVSSGTTKPDSAPAFSAVPTKPTESAAPSPVPTNSKAPITFTSHPGPTSVTGDASAPQTLSTPFASTSSSFSLSNRNAPPPVSLDPVAGGTKPLATPFGSTPTTTAQVPVSSPFGATPAPTMTFGSIAAVDATKKPFDSAPLCAPSTDISSKLPVSAAFGASPTSGAPAKVSPSVDFGSTVAENATKAPAAGSPLLTESTSKTGSTSFGTPASASSADKFSLPAFGAFAAAESPAKPGFSSVGVTSAPTPFGASMPVEKQDKKEEPVKPAAGVSTSAVASPFSSTPTFGAISAVVPTIPPSSKKTGDGVTASPVKAGTPFAFGSKANEQTTEPTAPASPFNVAAAPENPTTANAPLSGFGVFSQGNSFKKPESEATASTQDTKSDAPKSGFGLGTVPAFGSVPAVQVDASEKSTPQFATSASATTAQDTKPDGPKPSFGFGSASGFGFSLADAAANPKPDSASTAISPFSSATPKPVEQTTTAVAKPVDSPSTSLGLPTSSKTSESAGLATPFQESQSHSSNPTSGFGASSTGFGSGFGFQKPEPGSTPQGPKSDPPKASFGFGPSSGFGLSFGSQSDAAKPPAPAASFSFSTATPAPQTISSKLTATESQKIEHESDSESSSESESESHVEPEASSTDASKPQINVSLTSFGTLLSSESTSKDSTTALSAQPLQSDAASAKSDGAQSAQTDSKPVASGFSFTGSFDASKSSVLSQTAFSEGTPFKPPSSGVATAPLKLDQKTPEGDAPVKFSFGVSSASKESESATTSTPSSATFSFGAPGQDESKEKPADSVSASATGSFSFGSLTTKPTAEMLPQESKPALSDSTPGKSETSPSPSGFSFPGAFDASKSSVLGSATFSSGTPLKTPSAPDTWTAPKLDSKAPEGFDSSKLTFGFSAEAKKETETAESKKSADSETPSTQPPPFSFVSSAASSSATSGSPFSAGTNVPQFPTKKEDLSSEAPKSSEPKPFGFPVPTSLDPAKSAGLSDISVSSDSSSTKISATSASTSEEPKPVAPVSTGFSFSGTFDEKTSSVLSNTVMSTGDSFKPPEQPLALSGSSAPKLLDEPSGDFDISKISFGLPKAEGKTDEASSTAEKQTIAPIADEKTVPGQSGTPKDSESPIFALSKSPTSFGTGFSTPFGDTFQVSTASSHFSTPFGSSDAEPSKPASFGLSAQGISEGTSSVAAKSSFNMPFGNASADPKSSTLAAPPSGFGLTSSTLEPSAKQVPSSSVAFSMPFGKPTAQSEVTNSDSGSIDAKPNGLESPLPTDSSSEGPEESSFEVEKSQSDSDLSHAEEGIAFSDGDESAISQSVDDSNMQSSDESVDASIGEDDKQDHDRESNVVEGKSPRTSVAESSKTPEAETTATDSVSSSPVVDAPDVTEISRVVDTNAETQTMTKAAKEIVEDRTDEPTHTEPAKPADAAPASKPTTSFGFGGFGSGFGATATPTAQQKSSFSFSNTNSSWSVPPSQLSATGTSVLPASDAAKTPVTSSGFGKFSTPASKPEPTAPKEATPEKAAPPPGGFGLGSLGFGKSTLPASEKPASTFGGGFGSGSGSSFGFGSLQSAMPKSPAPASQSEVPTKTLALDSDSDQEDSDDDLPKPAKPQAASATPTAGAWSTSAFKPSALASATASSPTTSSFKPSAFAPAAAPASDSSAPKPSLGTFSFQTQPGQGVSAFSAAPTGTGAVNAFSSAPASPFGSSGFGQTSQLGANRSSSLANATATPTGSFGGSSGSRSSFAAVAQAKNKEDSDDEYWISDSDSDGEEN